MDILFQNETRLPDVSTILIPSTSLVLKTPQQYGLTTPQATSTPALESQTNINASLF